MPQIKNKLMAKLKFNTLDDALAYVNSLPIQEIIQDYARILWETQDGRMEPIKITKRQFENYFKIIGFTSDGGIESRGRKRLTER